jgi:hypothetical protein
MLTGVSQQALWTGMGAESSPLADNTATGR